MSFHTQINDICAALSKRGWFFCDGIAPREMCNDLRKQAQEYQTRQSLTAASVGAGSGKKVITEVRGDFIKWIDTDSPAAPEAALVQWLHTLTSLLNEKLFLALGAVETHYAIYPPGAQYEKHIDCFAGTSDRVLSFVLYLNDNWNNPDGGELIIFDEKSPGNTAVKIAPLFGRLVLFLSESIYHQVDFTVRERISVTGWLKKHPLKGV